MNLNQVTVPVIDIPEAIDFYEKLGLHLIVRSDHYARFECPEGDATFSLHLEKEIAVGACPVIYFECRDLENVYSSLLEKNITFDMAPKDQVWLWKEAHLTDPSGNKIILFHAGENRKNPPWRLDPRKDG